MGAEHATAEKVNAPAETREQELPAEEQATTEEGRILQLQRQFGNRAVTSLLRGSPPPAVVQRAIGFDPSYFKARSFKSKVRTAFVTDTFSKIGNALTDFGGASGDQHKLLYADIIIGLTQHWLDKYGSDVSQTQRKLDLTRLHREARQEARDIRRKHAPQAERAYLDKIDAGGFKGLEMARTKSSGVDPAEDLAAGRTTSGVYGADQRAATLVAQYRLTAAEIAAIRIFTLPDYTYINPAAAGSKDWLTKNLAKSNDLHIKKVDGSTLMQEGNEHARKVRQALMKIDPWRGGAAYRGERYTAKDFRARYKEGSIVPFNSFGSGAKERWVAENYAAGQGVDLKAATDENICVVAVLYHKTARDISRLSASFKQEEEVMILPGTKYKVDRILPMPRPELRSEKEAREKAAADAAAGKQPRQKTDEEEEADAKKKDARARESWYTVLLSEQ